MNETNWNEIVKLSESIKKQLIEAGNPHQRVVISQKGVLLESDERFEPSVINIDCERITGNVADFKRSEWNGTHS